MYKSKIVLGVLILLSSVSIGQKTKKTIEPPQPAKVWSLEKANAWYSQHKWLTGANYIPANAINQLEMWQAQTFDSATIDKELGWAESIEIGRASCRERV